MTLYDFQSFTHRSPVAASIAVRVAEQHAGQRVPVTSFVRFRSARSSATRLDIRSEIDKKIRHDKILDITVSVYTKTERFIEAKTPFEIIRD